ncbi:MAG TPA: tRNA (guanosine(46)-N7)-methyltransferase TrmB [Clostridia bacterium]|nr:tRNA (guanosine(46)-N7)-methyltransferase TrmB [Clostridia bacterium]
MRVRRQPGIEGKLREMPGFVLEDAPSLRGKWQEYFGNKKPLYVELGMGKGKFITTLARQHQEINFIGVERVPEIIHQAGKREREGLPNLCFLHLDVARLPEYFLPEEIARIYLNFSDPWPKKRHEKRRLTNPFFLQIYKRLLKKKGSIHFKTDSLDFFEYSLEQFIAADFSVQKIAYDLHHSGYTGNILTEYEVKFREKGYPICRCEAIKN